MTGSLPSQNFPWYTAVSGKAMLRYSLLRLSVVHRKSERSNHLSRLKEKMAGVQSRLRNERCRQACQQPLQRTLKSCGWLTPLPAVKVQPAQSPAENSQAKTRSQHKHRPGKGQVQMPPQTLAARWLMYSGCFSTGRCFENTCFHSATDSAQCF